MIAVWSTGHPYNETVTEAVAVGLKSAGVDLRKVPASEFDASEIPPPSISYGVLRGIKQIYHACGKHGADWWNVDRGFFGASHYDGYYRIGYRHLQPLFVPCDLKGDDSRFEKLGIEFRSRWADRALSREGNVLICPPTDGIGDFYGVNPQEWAKKAVERLPSSFRKKALIRYKSCQRPLFDDLSKSSVVVVYNSSVAFEALLAGIPAVSETGLVKTWNRFSPEDVGTERLFDWDVRGLFRFASWTQYTLDEIRSGYAWETLRKIYNWGIS